ncbi:hypothetical protein Tco_0337290 [Tanacetum coccineum]
MTIASPGVADSETGYTTQSNPLHEVVLGLDKALSATIPISIVCTLARYRQVDDAFEVYGEIKKSNQPVMQNTIKMLIRTRSRPHTKKSRVHDTCLLSAKKPPLFAIVLKDVPQSGLRYSILNYQSKPFQQGYKWDDCDVE